MHLTPEQFGWFAAIAIHDTSSVVGAATEFDPASVAIAVTAKLTRALWIIPLMLATGFWLRLKAKKSDSQKPGKMNIPWFIAIFVLASVLHAILPDMPSVYSFSSEFGKVAMKIAIFLTGAQLTRQIVKAVGPRAMAVAVMLWLVLSASTLSWLTFDHVMEQ